MESMTLDTLRKLVNGETKGEKMRFATKLYHLLQYTQVHQDAINIIGLFWCTNGINFICHTGFLGNFLGLKRNTINTNFRSHDFEHQAMTNKNCPPKPIVLEDLRNWRECIHKPLLFTKNATLRDIERIPCSAIPVVPQLLFQPPSILSNNITLLVGQNSFSSDALKAIFKQFPTDKATQIQDLIFNSWKAICGLKFSCESKLIVNSILAYKSKSSITHVLEENILNLLSEDKSFSQSNEDMVDFVQYTKFFLKYGDSQHACHSIEELSNFNTLAPEVSFQDWFMPGLSATFANNMVKKDPTKQWLLRPSSEAGKFTIHTPKCNTKVTFDCLTKKLSIEHGDGRVIEGDSWNELLFGILQLPQPKDTLLMMQLEDAAEENLGLSPISSMGPLTPQDLMSQFSFSSQAY